MDRILSCQVCFKTFNDGENAPDGSLPVDTQTNKVILVCQDCNRKRVEEAKGLTEKKKTEADLAVGDDYEEMDVDKASVDQATIRSSKTSRSQAVNSMVKEQSKAQQRQRPKTSMLTSRQKPTSASLAMRKTEQGRLARQSLPSSGKQLGRQQQRLLRHSQSAGMRNFKVLKGYIRKGLVDILDRDGNYRRGCSMRSFDESGPLESNRNLREG